MVDEISEQDDDVRGGESTWPAERVPGRLDAAQANRTLESSFMQSFKHALLGAEGVNETVEYLNDASEGLIHRLDPSNTELPYPLMMFSRFPVVPSENALQSLVDLFTTQVYPKMTFVRGIPIQNLLRDSRPPYLTFAMASIASMASGGAQSVTEAMWWAANRLITGTMEVDNREARKVDLLNAWILLETYGGLSADTSIWYRTNITHGYVETAARRLCLSYTEDKQADGAVHPNAYDRAIEACGSSAVPAFVLIDLLRSVHYGLPPTLARSELLSLPTQLNNDYNAIYSSIVSKSRSPPPGLGQDAALLALVAVLGDIHTYSTVFHLLGTLEQDDCHEDPTSKPKDGNVHFRNPYLPFSPENENRKVKRRLQKALDIWSQNYLARVSQDMATLFYFCKMYLALPSLPLLPAIAGYSPRSSNDSTRAVHQAEIVDFGIYDGVDAQKNAWRILENVGQSEELTPVWIPIVLFYASLVVWRLECRSGTRGMNGSLRVLRLFKSELENMKWPCCQVMADLLKSLMEI